MLLRRMSISIRWKVTLSTLLAVVCGLGIAGWLAVRAFERQEVTRLTETLEARTGLAVLTLQPYLATSEGLVLRPDLQALAREIGVRSRARVTVIRLDGTVIADSAVEEHQLAGVENHRGRPEVQQALATGQGTDLRASHTTGERTLYMALPVLDKDGASPVAIVRLGIPLLAIEQQAATLERSLAIAFGVAFLIAVALSIWLGRSLTRPLSEIAGMAQQLASGTTGQRLKTTARDEVGLLADTLNHMTEQLETKIREVSEDRAQLIAMLTAMVEGVLVLDYRGTILQGNPAFDRMFGLAGTDTRGHQYSDVIRHPQLGDFVSTVLATRANSGAELMLEPSGRCLHVEASVAGGVRENEACLVLVFHDITELRRLEKVRKDFVANVSHELRTPLTSIKGYVEALLDGSYQDLSTTLRFLEIILKQSDRLNLILDDLLQLSRMESGQVLFKQEPVQLAGVIDRTLAVIQPLAEKRGHRITVTMEPRLPPVMGDEERLGQVFSNLLDNAVKYTPEEGTITIEAHVAGAPPPGAGLRRGVTIIVADSGIGIPDADRPRVFERFYRVDKARSRELGGTGLGLAIVKHIVEGHEGRVWVEPNHPKGSRFVVWLPIGQEIPRSASPPKDR